MQTLLHEKGELVASCTTRWLSYEKCVQRIKVSFSSLALSLEREGEERGDAKAVGLMNLISDYHFICTLLLMADALPHLSHLSKCFQFDKCDYSMIPTMLSSTITSLKQLREVDGFNRQTLSRFLERVDASGIRIKTAKN